MTASRLDRMEGAGLAGIAIVSFYWPFCVLRVAFVDVLGLFRGLSSSVLLAVLLFSAVSIGLFSGA